MKDRLGHTAGHRKNESILSLSLTNNYTRRITYVVSLKTCVESDHHSSHDMVKVFHNHQTT